MRRKAFIFITAHWIIGNFLFFRSAIHNSCVKEPEYDLDSVNNDVASKRYDAIYEVIRNFLNLHIATVSAVSNRIDYK